MISLEDFQKADLRVGRVLSAEAVPDSNKLLRLMIDFGQEIGQRTIFSGIKKYYQPEELVGRQVIVILNLEPKKIDTEFSQGMLVSAGPILIVPMKEVELGTKIY